MGLIARALSNPQNTEITTSHELDLLLRQGNQVWAGMSVTPENAVEIAAVMACVRVIAEDIAKVPAIVYQRLAPPEGSTSERRQRASDSPWWELIHNQANTVQSSQAFRETMTAWALLRGNGFALKNPPARPGQQVREMLPVHPKRITIEQAPDATLLYRMRLENGSEKLLTRREMFHLPGLSLDGISGAGIVGMARQTFGIAFAAQRHASKFFANGLQTSGVFTHPQRLSDAAYERLKHSLNEDFTADQVYSPMILEEGMSWAQTGLSNRDSQFLEARKFEVSEIARWFRLSPHKIGDLERATHSNIEMQSIEHVTDTMMPWAGRWEHAWNNQLLPEDMYAELLFEGLLRGTTKERYEAYQLAAGGNAPWMSRNEVRGLENRDPLPGLDEILVPLNMGGDGDADDDGE